ncbi:MAG: respiratory chain complex I subunit 1 family protein [Armatimonadota bacterium]
MIMLLFALINIVVIPLLLVGVIRKIKARMQNRVGSPILQSFYDIGKLLRKSETISETASWVFDLAPRLNLAVVAIAALLVPWSGAAIPDAWVSATNLLLVIYLLGLGKFISMLAAMDTGSAFGGLGASREALISLLVEPALMIGLGALALGAKSMELSVIYSTPTSQSVAVMVGAAFVVVALAELSRMPVDDPTTHLELTMVHEAMILENSGRNLALVELAVALRTCIFFGLAAQTFLHAVPQYMTSPHLLRYGVGLSSLFMVGALVAVAEGVVVKLNWRRVPNFIAFAIALSSMAALIAVARG